MKGTAKFTHLLLLMAVLLPAWAIGGAPKNELTNSIPESVFFMVYAEDTDQADFVKDYWGNVWTDVQNAGVLQDLFSLLMGSVEDPEQRAMAQQKIDEAIDTVTAVDWESLVGGRMIYTMRYMEGKSINVNGENVNVGPPEEVWLFDSDPAKVDSNYKAMRGILEYIDSMSGENMVLEDETVGKAQYTFADVQVDGTSIIKFGVGRHGNVLAFSLHETLLKEIFENMDKGGAEESLIASERYQSAFKDLPKQGIKYVYFDMDRMADALEGAIVPALEMAKEQAGENDSQELMTVTTIMELTFREMRSLDRTAEVVHIDGYKVIGESYAYLGDDAKDTLVYKMLGTVDPVPNWSEYIPVEATSFSVSAGCDLNALYTGVREIVAEEIPNGEQGLAQFDQQLTQVGFSIEDDLLSWITTDSVSFSIPGMATGDGATIIRVKNADKAREMIEKAVTMLDQLAAQQTGQNLMRMPATQLGEEFELVTHPVVAAFIRPVIGVKGDRLFIGSSERAIALSLKTAAGEHDSVLKNERFQKQGVHPKGEVTKMTFKDLSGLGQELGQMFGMMGMAGAFIGAQPDAPKELTKVFSILQRLAPVAQRVDFLETSSSATVLNADGWYGIRATNYRTPEPVEAVAE
ncbi:hypothetical protein KQI84_14830 [bacterium]|nr:hypothetical protein [bacterium]